MLEVIATAIATKAAQVGVEILGERLKDANTATKSLSKTPHRARATFDLSNLQPSILEHLREMERWASFVSIAELRGKKKSVESIFVRLDAYLTPRREIEDGEEQPQRVHIDSVLRSSESHIVLLGQPGAGKTTQLRKLCLDFLRTRKILGSLDLALLVRLRDLSSPRSDWPLLTELMSIFPLTLSERETLLQYASEEARDQHIRKCYLRLLDQLGCVIVLDGFDEVQTSTRERLLAEIRHITDSFETSRILITCRTGQFQYVLPNTSKFEIAPLDDSQIATFAKHWLSDTGDSERFIRELRLKPFYGTSMKPLFLAHLCAIFERTGQVPAKPKNVYEKIVRLALEDWDGESGVKRATNYSKFTPDEKHEFLSQLSFELTTALETYVFSTLQLERAYKGIYKRFDLPAKEARQVARELETHTGLFIQTSQNQFEFFHRSMQEFLAAEYIVKLPTLDAVSRHLHLLPNQLAIATAISTSPGAYLSYIVLGRYMSAGKLSDDYFDVFATRLTQEEPSFEEYPLAVLALFVLASLTHEDEAVEKLANAISKNNDLRFIKQYYTSDPDPRDTTASRMHCRIFRLQKEHHTFELPNVVQTSAPILAF